MRTVMNDAAFPERDFRVERVAAPLRHSVTENIRYAIATGRFKGGERLPERELCELTGVSRTLIREALRQLESEGLIEVVPHRGPVVATLSADQARDIYEVRIQLEGLACKLFAEKATMRDAERRAAESHFQRLRSGRPESIETSAIHLDIIRDLKRIHGHIASIGYPILESANALRESRLMETKEARARQEREMLLPTPQTGH